MDISQLMIIIGAVLGIALVGLLAIVPSALDFPGPRHPLTAPGLVHSSR